MRHLQNDPMLDDMLAISMCSTQSSQAHLTAKMEVTKTTCKILYMPNYKWWPWRFLVGNALSYRFPDTAWSASHLFHECQMPQQAFSKLMWIPPLCDWPLLRSLARGSARAVLRLLQSPYYPITISSLTESPGSIGSILKQVNTFQHKSKHLDCTLAHWTARIICNATAVQLMTLKCTTDGPTGSDNMTTSHIGRVFYGVISVVLFALFYYLWRH